MLVRSYLYAFIQNNFLRRTRRNHRLLPTNVAVLELRLLLSDVAVSDGPLPPTQTYNATTGDPPPLISTSISYVVSGHATNLSTLFVYYPDGTISTYQVQGPFSVPAGTQSDGNTSQTLRALLDDPLLGAYPAQHTITESSFSRNIADLLKPAAPAIPPFISGIVNSAVPPLLSNVHDHLTDIALQQYQANSSIPYSTYLADDTDIFNGLVTQVESLASFGLTNAFNTVMNGDGTNAQKFKITWGSDNTVMVTGMAKLQADLALLPGLTANLNAAPHIASLTWNDPNVISYFNGNPGPLIASMTNTAKFNASIQYKLPTSGGQYFFNTISGGISNSGIGGNPDQWVPTLNWSAYNNDPNSVYNWNVNFNATWDPTTGAWKHPGGTVFIGVGARY